MTKQDVDIMSRREALKKTATLLGGMALLPAALRSGVLSATTLDCNHSALAEITPYSRLIGVLSELIIPETDTPGAIKAGVPDYIELILSQWYNADERRAFLVGLATLDAIATKQGHAAFTQSPESAQVAILHKLDKQPQHNIFDEFKSLTVFGYYTSEAATKELNYSLIPSGYRACVPLEEIGRTWLQRGI